MRSFRDRSIEQKFLLATLAITLSALLVTSGFLIAFEWRAFKQTRIEDARTVAGIIAANAEASMIYGDEKDARSVLSGIRAQPVAVAAALYRTNGTLFASVPTNLPASDFPERSRPASVTFRGNRVEAFENVGTDRHYLGAAYVRFDVAPMYQRFRIYLGSVLAVVAGCVALVVLLSKLVQRWISRPLVELAGTAKSVAQRNDYSLRALKRGRDEVGELVDAFNHMLDDIEAAHGKLKHYAADLERDVAARTAELVKSVSELEAFSYSVSHDMRAPLRAMQGYAQLLVEECGNQLSPEAQDYLQRIRRASVRLDALIQDILTYSRISRAEIELTNLDLDRLVEDVIAEYPQLSAANAGIQVRHPLGRALGHAASLTQVISNLLTNAVKFVRPDAPSRIEVFAERRDGRVRVCVRDNGLGIAEKDLERIFRIFERVHDNKSYEGTGIGLSIVKKAVERMGGTVGVESRPGEGSTFWFELNEAP